MLKAIRRRLAERGNRPRNLPGLEALEDRSVPAIIGGTVYVDLHASGLFAPGDPTLANNTIQLYNSAGTLLGTTTTDANGHYQFSIDPTIGTAPATQEVDTAFAPTPTDVMQTQSVAQFNPALGTLTGVEIISDGAFHTQAHVENLDTTAASVDSDFTGTLTLQAPGGVTLTANPKATFNGTAGAFDGGTPDLQGTDTWDSGIQTVTAQTQTAQLSASTQDLSGFIGTGTVNLTENASATSCACGAGNLLGMVHTTAEGHVKVIYQYTPSNALQPGSYKVVQVTQPDGYIGGWATNDNVNVIVGSNKTDFINVQLGTTDTLNNNFGEIVPGKLSGIVYYDQFRLGAFGNGSIGLAGIPVTLTGSANDGTAVTETVLTGSDGSYSFGNLYAGTYFIYASQPAGYLPGTDTVGSLGGTLTGNVFTVNMPSGGVGTNYNFGEVLPTPTRPPVTPPQDVPVVPTTPTPTPLTTVPGSPGKLLFVSGGWANWGW
jgi:hypothetical protein